MSINAVTMTLRIASYGEGFFGKIKTFFVIFVRLVCWKFGLPVHEVDMQLRMNNVLCTVSISRKPDDLWVLHEILVQEEYKITEIDNPHVIVDAGGNIGVSAMYFATRFPHATVYTVEADPTTFIRLQKNTAPFKNIIPIHAAITSRSGEDVVFYHSERSVSSSLKRRSQTDIEVRVPSISIDSLMRTYGISTIDICKFDIEGGEADALAVGELDKKIRFCIGEVHMDLMELSQKEFMDLFSGFSTRTLDLGKERFIIRAGSNYFGTTL